MPPFFRIRRARTDDVSAIRSLIELFVPDGTLLPRSPEFIREHLGDYFVADDAGDVVGCVQLEEYSPSLAEIRSLAVAPRAQGRGVGIALVDAAERLGVRRSYRTLFAVSNNEAFFVGRGYEPRQIPELDRERSEVSRFKGVYAKDLAAPPASDQPFRSTTGG